MFSPIEAADGSTMELILGTAQLGAPYGVLSDSAAARGQDPVELIRIAAETRFDAIDTAPAYGSAESLIGVSRVNCRVHTKLDPRMEPSDSLSASLGRLQRDAVDVLYLHDPDAATRDGGSAVTRAHSLIGSGAHRLGLSVYTEEALLAGLANPHVDVIQIPVSPVDTHLYRSALGVRNRAVAIIGRSLLAQGLLVANSRSVPLHLPALRLAIEKFQALATEFGVSPIQLAVRWAQGLSGLSGIVIGLASRHQLEEYTQALLGGPLDERLLEKLRQLPHVPPEESDARNWRRK